MSNQPDLFSYFDYRQYLKDRYEAEKIRTKHFSFRYFARVAGLSSSGYLKMVMDGSRNLSPTSINQFSKALKFNKKQAAYFEALVLFNQAKSDRERDNYFDRLSALRPAVQLKGLEKDQYEYFTKKHFVFLREMVALPHFQEDAAWIAKQFRPALKTKDVEHSLEVLLHLGLLGRDSNGELVHSDASITKPAEVDSVEVYNFHQDMLNEAKLAMLTAEPSRRDITSLTIPIPKKSLMEIKQRIKNFREELIDYVNKGSEEYHDVYQLNLQLFPVTHTRKESS